MDLLYVLVVDVFAYNLDEFGIALELDFAHVLDGINMVDYVHVVRCHHLSAIVPVGLVAVIFLGVVRCSDVNTALATQKTHCVREFGSGSRSFE